MGIHIPKLSKRSYSNHPHLRRADPGHVQKWQLDAETFLCFVFVPIVVEFLANGEYVEHGPFLRSVFPDCDSVMFVDGEEEIEILRICTL